jgi:putative phosphoesterase
VDGPDVNLPETLEFEFGGVRIAMIHDSGPRKGRRIRVRRRFPDARVIVFGHSHIPLLEDEDGLLLLNPGSPTDRRRQPEHTFALLRVEEREARAEIKVLP